MSKIKNGVHIGGAVKSKKEYRDVVHETLATPLTLLPSFDADFSKVPVQMQNQLGICVSEAVCSLIERFRNDGIVLSRRFQYVGMKKLIDGNLDEGSSVKSGLQFAYKYGTQPESLVPTDTTTTYEQFINFDVTPYLATATKIPGYISIPTDIVSIAEAIQKYGGVAFRYEVGKEWYTDILGNVTWLASAILPLRKPRYFISGHAICGTGYDFTAFKKINLRNSWSTAWALMGDGFTDLSAYPPTEAWAITPTAPVIPDDTHIPFTKSMYFGMNDTEVNRLQRILKKFGYMTYQGANTDYYGKETAKGVLAFQVATGVVKFGIESGFGNIFGPRSILEINSLIK